MKYLIVILAILFTPISAFSADYSMVIATPFAGSGVHGDPYRPAFSEDYACGYEDITGQDWASVPNVYLLKAVCSEELTQIILEDDGYLVLSSQVVPPGTANPALTLLPSESLDSNKLVDIASALTGYGLQYDGQGVPTPIPPCPPESGPLKCNQLQQATQTASVQAVQQVWSGKTRAQVIETLKTQMKAFPRGATP